MIYEKYCANLLYKMKLNGYLFVEWNLDVKKKAVLI
jgi:hypothetical protein